MLLDESGRLGGRWEMKDHIPRALQSSMLSQITLWWHFLGPSLFGSQSGTTSPGTISTLWHGSWASVPQCLHLCFLWLCCSWASKSQGGVRPFPSPWQCDLATWPEPCPAAPRSWLGCDTTEIYALGVNTWSQHVLMMSHQAGWWKDAQGWSPPTAGENGLETFKKLSPSL